MAPIAATLMTYFAMLTGLVAKTNGVSVPWTMPPFISGYLATNSISGSVMQLVNILVTVMIYFPFFKIMDNQLKARELK